MHTIESYIRFTTNIVSGTASTLSLLFIASQLQAPWSLCLASRIVTVPRPFSLVTDTLGPGGIFPQFNRQLIIGVGFPTAVHTTVTVSPSSTVNVSGGAWVIVGEASN